MVVSVEMIAASPVWTNSEVRDRTSPPRAVALNHSIFIDVSSIPFRHTGFVQLVNRKGKVNIQYT